MIKFLQACKFEQAKSKLSVSLLLVFCTHLSHKFGRAENTPMWVRKTKSIHPSHSYIISRATIAILRAKMPSYLRDYKGTNSYCYQNTNIYAYAHNSSPITLTLIKIVNSICTDSINSDPNNQPIRKHPHVRGEGSGK